MRTLDTSSATPRPVRSKDRHRRRPPLVSTIVAAVVVVGAELAVRALAGPLAEPLVWRDWEAQNKVAAVAELEDAGGASVLVLGSSMANAAFDPEAFTASTAPRRPAFNGALDGADLRTVELWAREVVPNLSPDVVVIGVSTRELNDSGARQAEVFHQFVEAPEGAVLAGSEDLLDRLERVAERYSALFRYRGVLRHPLDAFDEADADAGSVSSLGTSRAVLELGDEPFAVTAEFELAGPRTVYNDLHIGGPQTGALLALTQSLRDDGTAIVIVNMPVTDAVLRAHPGGSSTYASAVEQLAALASTEADAFVDLGRDFDRSEFRDQFHLNAAGRARFTALLTAVVCDLPADVCGG